MKNQLNQCPKCASPLKITQYGCPHCGTRVEGEFSGCSFCHLDDEDRLFALVFLQTEGNMKDVERLMGISYPTVKARLARLNNALSGESMRLSIPIDFKADSSPVKDSNERAEILDLLSSGEITPKDAATMLRGEKIETDNDKEDE